ncbi:MFS transporter [Acinetobacter sp. MD2]|uniref:MFS transporter n=1 Tax=Acinetobacter sp. MD2 TaxID=2600066 RepID=UPI002D1E811A|nr:MFS transporter [Acinetobacter sp. MD2]MEB3767218.1 MFS transporter [Acinetobacter sp. MD2]
MSPAPQTLSRSTLMFPLALVLFEFAVYMGNDLIQPAMLAITRDFGVGANLAPSAMSFYLFGGACVAWLLGPLSDRIGRRRVLLTGALFFALCCILILFTQNMQQFLTMRLVQGIGLTVVSAVGYAAIQESFAERDAIKVMALMSNISLLAPLLGPVVGAFLIDYVSWHWGFIGIAVVTLIAWFGLNKSMPKQQQSVTKKPFNTLFQDFKQVFSNKKFLALGLALPLGNMPLMLWIALSPVMLVDELKLSSFAYGLSQFPVFIGLIAGNIVLIKIMDRFELGRTVLVGVPMMCFGALFLLAAVFVPAHALALILIGMTIISFGEGLCFSVLYRFALMSSDVSKGTVAASLSMLIMFSFFVFIEVGRWLYMQWHLMAFACSCLAFLAIWLLYPRVFLMQVMKERREAGTF